MVRSLFALLLLAGGGLFLHNSVNPLLPAVPFQPAPRILIFSKTTGFRHDSIPDGIAAIRQLGQQNGFDVDATEDAANFTEANLSRYRAVVWLSTTGDVLDSAQQMAFERYLRSGGGFAGVHSASDTEYDWAWYGGLAGAYFRDHPAIQRATIRVEETAHPSTVALPTTWERTDEWYNFRTNPRGRVKVLATLDEQTYSGGNMGADHPIAWCQLYDGGRAWYTAGGHTKESYAEPLFRQHLLGGIQFAAGMRDGACATLAATSAASFQADELASESLAAVFGSALATTSQIATTTPLPTMLAGTSIRFKDSMGTEHLAPLFFVSPSQINLLVPAGTATGASTFTVIKADATAPSGLTDIHAVAPALFAANANGRGVVAGVALIRTKDAGDFFLPLAVFDPQTNGYVARPLDISDSRNEYFLVLFGTGLRGRGSLDAVSAQIGGLNAPVLFAGAQGDFAGLDQVNLHLPRELTGRGVVDVTLTVEGKAANVVQLSIQ